MSGSRSSSWRTRRLGDLLTYEQPTPYLVRSTDYVPWGRYPVLTAGKTFVLGYTNEPDGAYTEYPVIIFDDFTTRSKYVAFEFKAKSSAMKMLKARGAEADLRFMYERMQLIDYPIFDHKRRWIAEFSKLEVEIPSLKEQQAIARVAEDLSGYIAALQRMIVKKEALRQGMMHQLLTGETRLPGFDTDWQVGPLKKYMPLQRGFDLPISKIKPGPYPVVYSNGVGRTHAVAMVKGPGVVTGRSGTIGRVHFIATDYWPHNTSLWVTNFSRVDPKFCYYYLSHIGLGRFASGSGVPTFNRNDAHGFEVRIPSDRKEQERIAHVLSDIDEEATLLGAQLDKARDVKRGMMQQLLTGRTQLRLVGVEG